MDILKAKVYSISEEDHDIHRLRFHPLKKDYDGNRVRVTLVITVFKIFFFNLDIQKIISIICNVTQLFQTQKTHRNFEPR